MRMLRRVSRWLLAMAFAVMAGALPSCASMGGGGMHYDSLLGTSLVEALISS
jgi:hypothetical protein